VTVAFGAPTAPPQPVRRSDALAVLVGLTVCLLPFLNPPGPGNTAAADAGIVMCILLAVLWTAKERLAIKLPYVLGVTLLVMGGAVASIVAHAPITAGLTLLTDLLLLAWAAVIALGRHNVAIVGVATRAWSRLAVVYSGVMVVAYALGIDPLTGVTAKDGVRASYTFGDPNLAGNYLVVSLFVIAASKHPRSVGLRRIGYVLVLLAIGFTGSNGAMITLFLGAGLAVSLTQYRRGGAVAGATALAACATVAGVMVGVVMPRVDVNQIREQAAGSIPLLRDSFGRSASSTSERATIVREGARLFLQGDATGYGPARTKATLRGQQASYVKEAHNDYLATLLERGFIGALGLVLLGVAIAARCLRLAFRDVPPEYAEVVPRAWLLTVVGPMMASAAAFYEVLHFRHLWTWLGIVAALVLAMQDEAARERGVGDTNDLERAR
jgi:O-antigen ligase